MIPILQYSPLFTLRKKKYGNNGSSPPKKYDTPSVSAEIQARFRDGCTAPKWYLIKNAFRSVGEWMRLVLMLSMASGRMPNCWKCSAMMFLICCGEV